MASLLSVLGCGPAVSEQDSAREQPARQTAPLYVQNGVTRWSPGATIPVCWINPGFEAEKDVIVRALRHTWEAYGNITFGGFIPCPTTGTQRFIRVLVELGTDTWGGGSSFQGQGALRSPTTDVSVRSTHIALPQNGHLGRIEYLAVHEFGHVLGFGHEQDRADNTSAAHETCNPEGSIAGTYVTAYDGQSVMHYCNRGGNVSGWLSNEDKNGVAAAYGARVSPVPPAKYLAADVNGGGRADLIYLWAGGINTLLSSGHGTYPLAAEAWKPRGDYRMDVSTTEWLAADVNGDGRADLLHLWANGINTLLSAGNGTYSLVAEAWKPRTDYTIGLANTRWLAADVNNDGRADLLHLWDGGINTLLSAGNGTYALVAEGWKLQADYDINVAGTRWLAADVNNDGRADLLHLWDGGINTLLSAGNGTYSLAAGGWKPRTDYTIGLANTRWLAADVNNDGRADLLHLWDGGINTLLSAGNGTYALVAEAWKPRADYAMNLSTTRWLAADMNAAGGADLLHLRYGLINTLVSFGNGTFPSMMEGWDPQPWFDMD